jgi:hypothetical protein
VALTTARPVIIFGHNCAVAGPQSLCYQSGMALRTLCAHLIGIAALVAALIVLPQAALAHPGHAHSIHVHASGHAPAAVAHADAGEVELSLTTAVANTVHHHGDGSPCSGDGCCTNGSCAACFGIVVPSLPLVVAPPPRRSIALSADSDRQGIDGPSLLRPPKTFA